ncbi:MAG: hypothetical protein KGL69_11780 [Alphaproteobacteria bacterium]|jgi:hypothetical protein|nr:hypothetical protein [Alphaproteobacteria bacterium]
MAERWFEADLERSFAEAPYYPDVELFTARVTGRLDRGWAFRRLLIGSLGLVGGLVGGLELVRSGLVGRLDTLSTAARLVLENLGGPDAARGVHELMTSGATLDQRMLWMSGALALLAAGLLATRSLREF